MIMTLVAGGECLSCPANSFSPPGSSDYYANCTCGKVRARINFPHTDPVVQSHNQPTYRSNRLPFPHTRRGTWRVLEPLLRWTKASAFSLHGPWVHRAGNQSVKSASTNWCQELRSENGGDDRTEPRGATRDGMKIRVILPHGQQKWHSYTQLE